MSAEAMMATAAPRTVSHAYMLMLGVQINIAGVDAQDYARMRAKHLKALLQIISMVEDCEHSIMSAVVRADAHSLASTLADEVAELLDVVACDAEILGRSPKGGPTND